ncbi:MAG: carbamoyltransferase HypF [Neomegalonema sp.]|nr:carbamoyltransferase HypF [Neomegalonema sp.]
MTEGRRIRVRGQVQGVGFRPHVWRIANEGGLAGRVLNDASGVLIEIFGAADALTTFERRLQAEAPPLARIDAVTAQPLAADAAASPPFTIAASVAGAAETSVSPDAATCSDCVREILDPTNRRADYAFTNCTNCGPRLSIIEAVPYDRAATSMRAFTMCTDCQREYDAPTDRRFHAQPNACAKCGPRLTLRDHHGVLSGDPIEETARLIREGRIVAVKGVGGYQLACDALNETAVDILRQRKRRPEKPLAVMAASSSNVREYALLSEAEEQALLSPAAPIVLLRAAGAPLAPSVAPGQDHIGFMAPYTPLHHLLLRAAARPIVLTSGNRSDIPQIIADAEALSELADIADAWLSHDREIVNRLDDSVLRLDAPGPSILRRGRGLAPEPIPLAPSFSAAPRVLALGGELKSSFCLLRGREAVLSQHMGDLEDAVVFADFRRNLDLYRELYDFDPEIIAIDRHPNYLSSQWGRRLAQETGAKLIETQHHHAHLAACLAEHGESRGLGVILDGLGLGSDGTIWGGEFLLGGFEGFERLAHLPAVALPGGAQAMREPWRNTLAHLRSALGAEWRAEIAGTAIEAVLERKPLRQLEQMIDRGLNAPLASSAGRLFDAVAALLGFSPQRQGYEGQAASEMETAARPYLAETVAYPCSLERSEDRSPHLTARKSRPNGDLELADEPVKHQPALVDLAPLWRALLAEARSGEDPGRIAARFHRTLIQLIRDQAAHLCAARHVEAVALSGGVLQNKILLEGAYSALKAAGLRPLLPHRAPANDGGLALGQAAIAASQA